MPISTGQILGHQGMGFAAGQQAAMQFLQQQQALKDQQAQSAFNEQMRPIALEQARKQTEMMDVQKKAALTEIDSLEQRISQLAETHPLTIATLRQEIEKGKVLLGNAKTASDISKLMLKTAQWDSQLKEIEYSVKTGQDTPVATAPAPPPGDAEIAGMQPPPEPTPVMASQTPYGQSLKQQMDVQQQAGANQLLAGGLTNKRLKETERQLGTIFATQDQQLWNEAQQAILTGNEIEAKQELFKPRPELGGKSYFVTNLLSKMRADTAEADAMRQTVGPMAQARVDAMMAQGEYQKASAYARVVDAAADKAPTVTPAQARLALNDKQAAADKAQAEADRLTNQINSLRRQQAALEVTYDPKAKEWDGDGVDIQKYKALQKSIDDMTLQRTRAAARAKEAKDLADVFKPIFMQSFGFQRVEPQVGGAKAFKIEDAYPFWKKLTPAAQKAMKISYDRAVAAGATLEQFRAAVDAEGFEDDAEKQLALTGKVAKSKPKPATAPAARSRMTPGGGAW